MEIILDLRCGGGHWSSRQALHLPPSSQVPWEHSHVAPGRWSMPTRSVPPMHPQPCGHISVRPPPLCASLGHRAPPGPADARATCKILRTDGAQPRCAVGGAGVRGGSGQARRRGPRAQRGRERMRMLHALQEVCSSWGPSPEPQRTRWRLQPAVLGASLQINSSCLGPHHVKPWGRSCRRPRGGLDGDLQAGPVAARCPRCLAGAGHDLSERRGHRKGPQGRAVEGALGLECARPDTSQCEPAVGSLYSGQ